VIVVAKIGTSSITDEHGEIARHAVDKLCAEVAGLRSQGHRVVVVTSGAIAAGLPALGLEPLRLADGTQDASAATRWLAEQAADKPALVYATAEPAAVRKAQEALGIAKAGALVEEAMAEIAAIAVKRGTTRLIVAGGETSGAVVAALGARARISALLPEALSRTCLLRVAERVCRSPMVH